MIDIREKVRVVIDKNIEKRDGENVIRDLDQLEDDIVNLIDQQTL